MKGKGRGIQENGLSERRGTSPGGKRTVRVEEREWMREGKGRKEVDRERRGMKGKGQVIQGCRGEELVLEGKGREEWIV